MSDDTVMPERPPTSGPGSAATKWRAYAAAVTDSPAEAWAELDRDGVIALLREQGVLADEPPTAIDPSTPTVHPVGEQAAEIVVAAEDVTVTPAPRRGRFAEWMVPTDEGPVPEYEYERRARG